MSSIGIAQSTLEDLGWDKLLGHLARRAHTARGEAACASLAFFDQPEAARARIAEIAEARHLTQLEAPMPFGGVRDVATAVARAGKGGVLDAEELIAVGSTARAMARLRKHLDANQAEAPRLAEIAADIADLPQVYKPILDSFGPDGRLADHASEALGPLRRKVLQITAQLEQRIRSFVDDSRQAAHLQDRYFTTRDDRYVVPVRLESRSQVRGIIHGTSQSGRTLFIEPEAVVELQNRLKLAQCDVDDEERRILAELSSRVAHQEPALRAGLDATTVLDIIDAGARLAHDLNASAPAIDTGGEGGRLSLSFARHPLMVLSDRPCVPNDIVLEPRTIMILSGPNAGGKTVALKTAGLSALLTRAGLHVPAEPGSSVPWFTTIHSDIGDAQNLEQDLSTFSGHILELRKYLESADGATLLLIDEIAVGTEPEQGAALAQAVLEALAARGAAAIVTTHYERLKALAASDSRFANASVGFDIERMEPTFRLHLGVPGSSGAFAVARRMGLAADVVDHAEVLLGERRASVEELLAEVAEERRRLVDERAAVADEQRRAESARREAEAAREAFEDRRRKLHEGAHLEAVAALRQTRDELDRLRADLKRQARAERQAADPATLAAVKGQLTALSNAVSGHAPKRAAPRGIRVTADALVPGTAVYVTSLGSRGQVVEAPQRGRVMVQVGTMRSAVPVAEVLLDTPATRQAAAARAGRPAGQPGAGQKPDKSPGNTDKGRSSKQRSAGASPSGGQSGKDDGDRAGSPASGQGEGLVLRTDDITVDVRGERAEEAVDSVDRFIDRCLRNDRDLVFVIHGHGTGALRSAIRGHLASHHAVTHWRPGERAEGGDGVTIAWLDVA